MQQLHTQNLSSDNGQQTAQRIQNVRIVKEFEYLKSLNRKYEIVQRNEVIIQNVLQDQQKLHIIIPKQYPFKQPLYALSNTVQQKRPVSQIIEQWVPKVRIFELIELIAQRINQKQKIKGYVSQFLLLKGFHSIKAINLIILLAIVLRIMVALGSYSGQADHPYYGDFEAHRNWMSITLNRNIQNWYDEIDEQPWWRIDYPPVAAYLSYIFGKIYQSIEPDALRIQRGYQSQTFKVYMRFTVLLVDLIFLFPPIYLLSNQFQKKIPQLLLLLVLIKPDAILIDHGHFQYNSLILGLILMSFYCIVNKNWYLACFLYTIALHAKQMATYFSLAFLAALIGVTYTHYRYSKPKIITEMIKYGTIVIVVTLLIWLPWLGSLQSLQSVLSAIFPIHRGLYQLKVPNFWCISDIVMNWQAHFSKRTLLFFCFLASIAMSIPSMISMIVKPTNRSLLFGFATISMSFFMFSYHVHQKSVLLALLLMPFVGEVLGGWFIHQFIIASCCGLYHLLKEDNQQFGYFGLVIIYSLFSYTYIRLKSNLQKNEPQETTLRWHNKIYNASFLRIIFALAVVGLHVVAKMISPPAKLPYLFHLLMAALSFAYNVYFLLLSNSLQLEWLYQQYSGRIKKTL